MEQLEKIYREAKKFTEANHMRDLKEIRTTTSLIRDFDRFYKEYCYCVIASGFRANIAARLVDNLTECAGDYDKCMALFNNKNKVRAICKCYEDLHDNYKEVSETWKRPEDLVELPFIGPITCYHLARNIGLQSCVKPDLHLMRIVQEVYRKTVDEDFVEERINELAERVGEKPGLTDFCLWVWLSHHRGAVLPCCGSDLRLR